MCKDDALTRIAFPSLLKNENNAYVYSTMATGADPFFLFFHKILCSPL